MAIRTDRSNLPAGDHREGCVPDADSFVADAMIDALTERIRLARIDLYGSEARPMSRDGAIFRHSDAAGCARALGYKMQGIEPTNPPTDTDLINMWWGSVIHDEVAKAIEAHGEGWSTEVACGFDDPVKTAGHVDALHETDDKRTVIELKTVGGYAFKLAVGDRGQANGPSWSAIVQGALNATALDADELVIVDIAKELISKGTADKKGIPDAQRGLATWTYDESQFRPIAEKELRRVRRVHELVVKGEPVPAAIDDPEIPSAARIVDPSTGRWQVTRTDGTVAESGSYWACPSYCGFRDHCAAQMAAEQATAAA